MKLVNYRCKNCGKETEVLYNDSEEIPEKCTEEVCECGGELLKWNFKHNEQVWKGDL